MKKICYIVCRLLLMGAALLPGLDAGAQEDDARSRTPERCRIVCVGDIVLGLNYPDDQPLYAEEDGTRLFDSVEHWLRGADLAVGNLEGVLLDEGGEPKRLKDTTGRYLFRMPERYAHHLAEAGFDALSLANNHARDFGAEGMRRTIERLSEAGIACAGIEELCERAVVVRGPVRYGICAFAPNAAMCNIHDYDRAAALIRALREEDSCRLVIVSFHGGAEGSSEFRVPREREEYLGEWRGDVYRFAHHCIDAGADLVFGHGPHVVRGMELYRGRLIAYSLGNFCTPYGVSKAGRNGYAPLLLVELSPRGEFLGGELVPARQQGRSGPHPDREGLVIQEIRRLSRLDFPESPLVISPEGKLSVR